MNGFLRGGHGFFSSWQLVFTATYNFLIFSLFLFNRNWGIGLTFFEIAHLVPVFLTTNNKTKSFYAKIVLAIIISFFFWVRADHIIQTLCLLTVIGLNIVIFQEARTGELVSSSYLFKLPFIWLEKFVYYTKLSFEFLLSWHLKLKGLNKLIQSETIKKVVVGAVLSIPILFILILLFSSADQNFQNIFIELLKKVQFLLNLEWIKNIHWIGTFTVQFGFFWVYLCLVFPYTQNENSSTNNQVKYIIEKITVGVLVAAVFATFIITQFKSISFILDGFTTGKLNPSIFVREGFFQLLISCLVGLGVFHILKKDLAKNFLTLFLLIEVFLVSLIAGERVWLYQYQFGLTQARVWGMFFLVFLMTFIITLFLNLKNKINDRTKWQTYTIAFSFIVLSAGFVNIDHLISTFRPPVVEGKVDVRYMARNLSWDAADLWVNGLKDLKSGDMEYKYLLVSNLNLYIATQEQSRVPYNLLDVGRICSVKRDDWLSENISVAKNKKQICDNYPAWMDFKSEYEKSHGISNTTNPFSNTSQNNPGSFSCHTLNTKMIIGADGRGEIGCDIAVNGQINLSSSYCEGQKTHITKSLIPDAYQRINQYYATLKGLDLNEEVKVFVYTSTGSRVECLPSLNI